MIPYGRQTISTDDIQAVVEVLKSNWITQGPQVTAFEDSVATYCKAKHAIAVCNGTAALHLALLGLNIKHGDAVIVPSMTFLASVNCVEYVGARPLFADIDSKTYNIDVNQVEHILKKEQNVKAIIAVDFAGFPAPIKDLKVLAKRYGVKLIEDASHSLGAEYYEDSTWKKIGTINGADATVFSFHPVKSITTGEGGMILTEEDSLASSIRELRTHGMKKEVSQKRPWLYEMEKLGFNYRITDFQCALGISQLKHLDQWIEKRQQLAKNYDEIFQSSPHITRPIHQTSHAKSSVHLYVIQCNARDDLYHHLKQNEIASQVHYFPIHLQPYYQKKYDSKRGDLPVTEAYAERCLSLPCYVDLSEDICLRIGENVLSFFK